MAHSPARARSPAAPAARSFGNAVRHRSRHRRHHRGPRVEAVPAAGADPAATVMLPPGFPQVVLLFLGLAIGSFLNVCIHRLPLKLSVVSPGSRCPGCSYALRWYDNLPVLSYAMLRGRCRSCGRPISLQYPIIEVITAIVFLAHWYAFGPTSLLPARLVFASALIVLFMIDLEHQILPDVITLPGIIAGLVLSVFLPPGPLPSLLGVIVGGGLLWGIAELWFRLRHVEAMGFGDVKMLAMVGAWLGVKMVV